jgi:GTP-binding protein
VSGKPGKTQALNFFEVDNLIYLVDLPGYGYAQVSKSMQIGWQKLISQYLEERSTLRCVVVIIDIRHSPKKQDFQLLQWLRSKNITILPVYTKADKISANERTKNSSLLDAGLGITSGQRIIFSAKSGLGLDQLKESLENIVGGT